MRIVDSSALYRKAKKPCIGLCYLKKIGKVSQIAEDEEEEEEVRGGVGGGVGGGELGEECHQTEDLLLEVPMT